MSQIPTSDGFTYATPPSKGMAVTSLVLGILGCIPLVGIVAVILGIIAMRRAKAEPQRFGGSGLALGGIICGAVLTVSGCTVFGLTGVMLPALGQARQAARHTVSKSQLRQIGMGLFAYATDYKDAFPETEVGWQDRLVPKYLPDAGVFKIPGDRDDAAKYIYVPGLVLSQLPNPATTVLAYESNPRPWKNLVSVLYADGHVDDLSPDQLAAALASAGQPATGKPSPAKPAPPKRTP